MPKSTPLRNRGFILKLFGSIALGFICLLLSAPLLIIPPLGALVAVIGIMFIICSPFVAIFWYEANVNPMGNTR